MEENHPAIKRIHWYLFGMVIILVLIALLIISNLKSQPAPNETQTPVKTPTAVAPLKGTMTLMTKDELRRYKVGSPINLVVIGDSEGEDIVGFDVILNYDKTAFTLGSISTPLTQFQTFKNEKETLVVTAIQSPNVENREILSKSTILNITFIPKEVGNYTFTIVPRAGNETTKFVNSQKNPKPIYPKTSELKIEIF